MARAPLNDQAPGPGRRTARDARVDAAARATDAAERARLTFRRLSGLDRSGPPPPQTRAGQPLHPWTIPNAIGYVRIALLPVFLAFAFSSGDGMSATAATLYAVVAWTDYLDGIAARVTGQYSRLGALLDPLVDRLLIISGVVVCWSYDLLPRWALALLVARELFMLGLVRWGLRQGADIEVNWLGRAGVWPVMAALFSAIAGLETVARVCLYVGLVLVLGATAEYVREGVRHQRAKRAQPQAELDVSSSASREERT